jgi:hypothetical protein
MSHLSSLLLWIQHRCGNIQAGASLPGKPPVPTANAHDKLLTATFRAGTKAGTELSDSQRRSKTLNAPESTKQDLSA